MNDTLSLVGFQIIELKCLIIEIMNEILLIYILDG